MGSGVGLGWEHCVIMNRSYNTSVFPCLGSMSRTSRIKHWSGQCACHCCQALQSSRLCCVLYLYGKVFLSFVQDSITHYFALYHLPVFGGLVETHEMLTHEFLQVEGRGCLLYVQNDTQRVQTQASCTMTLLE